MEGRPRLSATADSSRATRLCHLGRATIAHTVHPFPSVLGRTGEDGLESTLSSVLGHTVFVTHGFSWRLGHPWGGSLGREARGVPEEAAWLGISLAEVAIKLSLGVGQPLPAGQLWSHRLVPLVSSVHCVWAEFQERASWRPVILSLIVRVCLAPGRGPPSPRSSSPFAPPPSPPPLTPPPGLQSLLVQLLQQRVAFGLGRPDAVCAHDAGGAVAVEHQDELLPLQLQLLYLGLQLCVHELQPL